MAYNKSIIMGNLTKDPETRQLNNGSSVTTINMASNETYTTKAGEKKDEVLFIEVSAFGKLGETIQKWFKKGMPILVDGKIKLSSWETDSGDKRSKHSIIMEKFTFCGGAKDGESKGHGNGSENTGKYATNPHEKNDSKIDEDVPF